MGAADFFGMPEKPAETIADQRKTVTTAGTAVALAASAAIRGVFVTAETDNTNIVTVGGSTVVGALATRRGIPLSAGDTIFIPVDDVAKVYIDCITNGEGVTFLTLA